MTRPASLALLLVPFAALSAGSLRAQTDSLGPLQTAVAATPSMKRVRVELRDGRRQEGTLYDPTAPSLVLTDSTVASQPIVYADVTRYWVRGHAAGTGAIVGASVGGIGGGLLGLATAVFVCAEDGGCHAGAYVGLAVVGAAAGAAVTGGVGALIGALFPRYHLKWKAT